MNIDRTIKPAESGNISFHLPETEKIYSENGLKIWYVNKADLPVIQLSLITKAGSKFDAEDKKGLAYLTTMMIDEGAGEYNALELDNEFESMGTILKINADHDSLVMNMLSLNENFEKSFELFSKILLEPHFSKNDFLREQKKLIDKISQLSDEPSYIASTVFEKIIYDNNPYGFPTAGYSEHIASLTENELRDFHNNQFVPSNCDLIVVGNIDKKSLLNIINNNLSNWKDKKTSEVKIPKPVKKKSRLIIIDKSEAAQSEIRIGSVTGPRNLEEFYSKVLLNTILGGQFSSRINLNLREDKGYTYGANSSFSYNKSTGYFAVSTSVQTENTVPSVQEILKELNSIKEGVSAEELDFAKSYLIKRFPSLFETYSQVAAHLSNKIMFSLPDNYYDTYIDKIDAVSVDDILSAAEKNIFPNELVILVTGDKNKISEELEKTLSLSLEEYNVFGQSIS